MKLRSLSEQEQAERQQLDEALERSRAEAAEAIRSGSAPAPGQVRALQDRRGRNGMGFYDEYVQTAREEPQMRPRRPNLDDLNAASFGPADAGWANAARNGHGTAVRGNGTVNGVAEDRGASGPVVSPQGEVLSRAKPVPRASVPEVLTVNNSVFALLSEQVKELRQQKLELQGIITEQEEKISELIGLVHQLMSQTDEPADPEITPPQRPDGDGP